MARKVPISFRETSKDIKLYAFLMSIEKGERSDWIKDKLREIIEREDSN